MNETIETLTPPAEIAEVQPAIEAPEAASIADHAAQFDPKREKDPDPEPAAAATTDGTTTEAPKDKGRRRAASAIATAEDVPRIGKLTARAKTAEERLAKTESELAELRQQFQTRPAPTNGNGHAASVAQPRPAAPRVNDPSDPEPDEKDYQGNPVGYLQSWNRWAARDEWRQQDARQQQTQHVQRVLSTFAERVDKAREEYPDFDSVALSGQSRIPEGSIVDQFVMTDDNGAKVLYHLHQSANSAELDSLLRMPVLQAMKHLALLSQRMESPQSAQAGVAGSVATPIRYLPPKPPNPARTEAQRVQGGPPPTDGSLSIADHSKHFLPQRRRR